MVGLVDDPAPRKVEPVAEIGEHTARAAPDRVRDMTRAARQGVDPDEGEAEGDHARRGERGASDGDAAAQPEQCERRKPGRVDDQAPAVRSQTAPADDDERGERDHREQGELD